jgi:UDP-4-amino-4,6-dideoxy-N-acetyl-beta-L-altrosamine transaminase
MNQKIIPYGRQEITNEDIEVVIESLKSDFLTQGPTILEFERNFADYVGSKYAVVVSNGTAALHLCALALDVNENSNIITTPITFVASANCIKYCNGNIWFADIDPVTYTLDISKVEALIESKPEGFFNGIIPVDFAGFAVDLEAFRNLANKHGLWIIEDSCHAPGGFFLNTKKQQEFCGNSKYAELAIFSFHPVKHIACGEGGMITTNDETLYQKLLLLRTHGITKNASNLTENHGGWYYEMQELGYNYRLTDFQAALGISQLKRADKGIERRREIANIYKKAFKDKKYILSQSDFVFGHAYHLYIIQIQNRKALYDYLRLNNIFCQVHYIPVHTMPYYKSLGYTKGSMPVAEKYYEHCLSLPMFPALTSEEQNFVIKTIDEFYKN